MCLQYSVSCDSEYLSSGSMNQSPNQVHPDGTCSKASMGCLILPLESDQWGRSPSPVVPQRPNRFASFSYCR